MMSHILSVTSPAHRLFRDCPSILWRLVRLVKVCSGHVSTEMVESNTDQVMTLGYVTFELKRVRKREIHTPHSWFAVPSICYHCPHRSHRHGGLCWPEQCSKLPQIKIWNNVNHRRFVNFHAMSTPPAQTKSPPCWRLSGDGSGPHYQPAAASSIPSLFRRFYHDLLQTS